MKKTIAVALAAEIVVVVQRGRTIGRTIITDLINDQINSEREQYEKDVLNCKRIEDVVTPDQENRFNKKTRGNKYGHSKFF